MIMSCLTYPHAFANAIISIEDQRKQTDVLTGRQFPKLILKSTWHYMQSLHDQTGWNACGQMQNPLTCAPLSVHDHCNMEFH